MPNRSHRNGAPLLLLILLLVMPVAGMADSFKAPQPSRQDRCPVCEMFVHRYPDFLAGITFDDGHTVFFCCAKDMFKYYLDLERYAPGRSAAQIGKLFVTAYDGMDALSAGEAFFVVGSDVYGPMGHELIPFARRGDALNFLREHQGKRIVTFEAVSPALIQTLD